MFESFWEDIARSQCLLRGTMALGWFHSQVQVKTLPQASPATRVAWLLTGDATEKRGSLPVSERVLAGCDRRPPYLEMATAVTAGLFFWRRCASLCRRCSSLHNTRCLSHPSSWLRWLAVDTLREFTNPHITY